MVEGKKGDGESLAGAVGRRNIQQVRSRVLGQRGGKGNETGELEEREEKLWRASPGSNNISGS